MNVTRINTFLGVALLTAALVSLSGCYYDTEEELYPNSFCDTESVTYSTRIEPIIQARCAIPGCHVVGGNGTGDFSTYAGLKQRVDNGTVKDFVVDMRIMPPIDGPPLTDCQVEQFRIWLEAGAPND